QPVVEGRLDFARRRRDALQLALDVGEPEQQEVDVLVLWPIQCFSPRLRVARCPCPALDLRHTKTSLKKTKAPGAGRLRPHRLGRAESIRLRAARGSRPAARDSRASR